MSDEIPAVLPQLADEGVQFRMHDVVSQLNPDNDQRRWHSVGKALMRLWVRDATGCGIARAEMGQYSVTLS